jgi:ABC-type sugar transport system permease subunit
VLPLSLALALFLDMRLPARNVIRTIVLLPTVTSAVVIATMWTFILHPANGVLNAALHLIGLGPFDFLTDSHQALPSLMLMALWQQVGFAAVIFLAGLQNIPHDIIDAANVDGASALRRFFYVVLPVLGERRSWSS